MRVFLIVLAVLVSAGSAAYLTLGRNDSSKSGSVRATGPLRLTGIVAAEDVIVSAKIGGRILQLNIDEGSWVQEGDLIALLDREELEAQQRNQEARLAQLAARLKQGREMVMLEEERTRGQVARAEAQLQLAESQRTQAQVERAQAEKDLARGMELLEEGILAQQEVERLRTAVEVGQARVKSFEDQVAAARADLDLARSGGRQVAVARQDVEQIQAQIDQIRADLEQVVTRLGYTEVYAPLSGRVSLRVAAQGEVIQAGAPIATIVDLNDVWVRAGVEESYVSNALVGRSLNVELASGKQLQGKVLLVSPEGDFATQRDVSREKRDIRTFGIKVQLPNPDHDVHPGMTAYVLLPVDSFPPAETTGSAAVGLNPPSTP